MSFKLSNSFNYEPNKTIEVLDSIMGSGKSTGIIKWIDDNPNQRYIYVSPLLSEVEQGGRLQQSFRLGNLLVKFLPFGFKLPYFPSTLR